MQKIVTTTAQNTKISPNPQRENPQEMDCLRRALGESPKKSAETAHEKKKKLPHQEPRRNFPIPRNEQIQNVSEKSKDTKYM